MKNHDGMINPEDKPDVQTPERCHDISNAGKADTSIEAHAIELGNLTEIDIEELSKKDSSWLQWFAGC